MNDGQRGGHRRWLSGAPVVGPSHPIAERIKRTAQEAALMAHRPVTNRKETKKKRKSGAVFFPFLTC